MKHVGRKAGGELSLNFYQNINNFCYSVFWNGNTHAVKYLSIQTLRVLKTIIWLCACLREQPTRLLGYMQKLSIRVVNTNNRTEDKSGNRTSIWWSAFIGLLHPFSNSYAASRAIFQAMSRIYSHFFFKNISKITYQNYF